MNHGTTIARLLELRALVIIGVLVFLCVSNNVGPRLLPLPISSESTSVEDVLTEGMDNALSRLPANSKADSFRVAIIAPTNRRAGAENSPLSVEAHAPDNSFVPPGNADSSEHFLYTSHPVTPAMVSRSSGRGPPLFV